MFWFTLGFAIEFTGIPFSVNPTDHQIIFISGT